MVVVAAAGCFELTGGYIGLILAACPSSLSRPSVRSPVCRRFTAPPQGPDDTHPYPSFSPNHSPARQTPTAFTSPMPTSPPVGRSPRRSDLTDKKKKKKNAQEFFYRFRRWSLFFTLFFPLTPFLRPLDPAAAASSRFFPAQLPFSPLSLLHAGLIVSRHRDFLFHSATGARAEGWGGACRVKSPRAERAPAATRPITYQNKTGFFTRGSLFLSFFFIFSPCTRSYQTASFFFSILTATYFVRLARSPRRCASVSVETFVHILPFVSIRHFFLAIVFYAFFVVKRITSTDIQRSDRVRYNAISPIGWSRASAACFSAQSTGRVHHAIELFSRIFF